MSEAAPLCSFVSFVVKAFPHSPIARKPSAIYAAASDSFLNSMAKLFEPPQYIAIEGPIRVGKSTLANIIADRMSAQRVIEPEDNPFLRRFYEGERGAAFQAQFAFLIKRFEQLQRLEVGPKSHKIVVADYIFEKDKLFAYIHFTHPELQ